jgi:copper chaperone|tara:strand:- start:232 stop:432 length:201 start_codon:yes stop_codon:yes gene_type:complete
MYKFEVNDMTCGHCASTVDKAVKTVDPGAQVRIDLTTHHVEIQSDQPASVFATAITDAGYTGTLQP